MSAIASVSQIVQGWSVPERKQALVEIVRNLIPTENSPFAIADIGYFTPIFGEAEFVAFDDSTPYLKEMRLRAENAEGSEIIAEFDLAE